MNILVAADYAPQFSGNLVGSVLDLGIYMREKNMGDVVFCFPKTAVTESKGAFPDWIKSYGFTVVLCDNTQFESEQCAFLQNIIKKYRIEIIHCHFGMFLSCIIKNRKCFNLPVIFHDHMDFPANEKKWKAKLTIARRSLELRKNKIYVITVSKEKYNAYVFAKKRYIENAFSFKRNIKESMERQQCRKMLGFNNQDIICMMYGWNYYTKGLDIAVEAVNICHKLNPNIKLAVLGLGKGYKKCEQTDFIRQSTSIDPESDWIIYLPSTEDMFAYHRAVDIFLSTSRADSFSYTLLEAISQDTPIVVSDIKGTKWALEYSKSQCFAKENFDGCAQAIQLLVENLDQEMQSNYQNIVNKYNINRWCEESVEVYSKLKQAETKKATRSDKGKKYG